MEDKTAPFYKAFDLKRVNCWLKTLENQSIKRRDGGFVDKFPDSSLLFYIYETIETYA